MWLPRELFEDASRRSAHNWSALARLGRDASPGQAAAELSALAALTRREYPGESDAEAVLLVPLRDELVGSAARPLALLLVAVSLLLIATCASVAQALLGRGVARRRGLAVRAALGASRAALLRLQLAESLLLAVAGAVLGLLGGLALGRAMLASAPELLPRDAALLLDTRLAAAALGAALLSALLAGLPPALRLSRGRLSAELAAGGRGDTAGAGRLGRALVAGESAVAVLLLAGTALLLRSLFALGAVEPGFEPSGASSVELAVPARVQQDPAAAARLHTLLLERLAREPGVAAAGLTTAPALSGIDPSGGLELADGEPGQASYRVVSGGYFAAMRIPLLQGRSFEARDDAGGEPVAVVNARFAARHFPGRNPLGERLRFLGMDSLQEPWLRVVGVVGDVRHRGLASEPPAAVYVHYLQRPLRLTFPTSLVVRGVSEPPPSPAALTSALREVEPELPTLVRPLAARLGDALARRRFGLWLLAGFGVAALLIAAAGTWGTLARSVALRQREIGVRVALGARPAGVLRLLLAEGLRPVAWGALAGALLSAAAGRLLSSWLYVVGAADPASHALALAVVGLVALLAAALPALRATRVDPVRALRAE